LLQAYIVFAVEYITASFTLTDKDIAFQRLEWPEPTTSLGILIAICVRC